MRSSSGSAGDVATGDGVDGASALTPWWRAIREWAHHSNSAFQWAPDGDDGDLQQATLDRRLEAQRGASSANRPPIVGAVTHALNGPMR